jgi:DMSO/TMAO reductase YedYZ molybdopterin-dependent catalytic subunit
MARALIRLSTPELRVYTFRVMPGSGPLQNAKPSLNSTSGQTLTRREMLHRSFIAGGALLLGFKDIWQAPSGERLEEEFRGGRNLGVVEFTEEARVPMGAAFGAELDERLYTDLSRWTPGRLVTPSNEFYIRTGASKLFDTALVSSVKIGGMAQNPFVLSASEIAKQAGQMGTHLMECAGNARAVHFGMMSVAEWSGVRIADMIETSKPFSAATHALISGFDQYESTSASSIPGASWIYPLEELKATQTFLATEMNGEPLTRNHGAPLRLVVPGWYGCCCIKWVNEITLVGDDAAATSQMKEYAGRTMQTGVPQLARDYQPATIDAAAMPIRIEKWAIRERLKYRVVGISWGGSQPATQLQIRFNPEEDYVAVGHPPAASGGPWAFWSHGWAPRQPGPYIIRLRVNDPRIRTRRLDVGAYVRTVEISEV